MAIETEAREIDGVTYRIVQLDARTALKVLDRFKGALGGALAAADKIDAGMLAMLGGESKQGKLSGAALAALGKAIMSISLADVEYVRDEFAKKTFVAMGGADEPQLAKIIDVHFAGKLTSMFKWLGACAEVNYADFLGVILTKLRENAPPEKPVAPTPTAS